MPPANLLGIPHKAMTQEVARYITDAVRADVFAQYGHFLEMVDIRHPSPDRIPDSRGHYGAQILARARSPCAGGRVAQAQFLDLGKNEIAFRLLVAVGFPPATRLRN